MTSLVNRIIEHDPLSSVIAVGSIARGDYRDDSDMDVVVVTWRFDTLADEIDWRITHTFGRWSEVRFDEGLMEGITCHLAACTPTNYQGELMTGPVWKRGPSKILYDASGIAKWGEECRVQFHRENPELHRKCVEFDEQYRRWKSDRSFERKFTTEEEFVRSLDLSRARISYGSFVTQVQLREIQLPAR